MKLLKTLKLRDYTQAEIDSAFHRQAARAVVFDNDNKIGLLYAKKLGIYKLPGGGIEEGEDSVQACIRECKEELGCRVKILGELGEIIEYREGEEYDNRLFFQESFHYLAEVVGKKQATEFSANEIAAGFELLWLDLSEAMDLIKNKKDKYSFSFVKHRELTVLQEAKKEIEKLK